MLQALIRFETVPTGRNDAAVNGAQRIMASINRDAPDRIPRGELLVEKDFINLFMTKILKYSAGPRVAEYDQDMEIEFYRYLGLDLVCVHGENSRSSRNYGNTAGYIQRFRQEGFFIFGVLDGPFQSLMNREGFVSLLTSVAGQPEAVAGKIRKQAAETAGLIERIVEFGAHGVIIADDIAYSKGTYVSPAYLNKHLIPCWRELVSKVGEFSIPVFFHSDGNINNVLPGIIEAGFSGLQCIEPASGMDIGAVKREYGQRLCLMGNLDPAILTEAGAPEDTGDSSPGDGEYEEIARAVPRLVSAAAPGGGFIFGTCSGLHAGLSPEKVNFMYKTVGQLSVLG